MDLDRVLSISEGEMLSGQPAERQRYFDGAS